MEISGEEREGCSRSIKGADSSHADASEITEELLRLARIRRVPIDHVRRVLHPVNLQRFRASAVVDWVAIRIRTSEPARYVTIRSATLEGGWDSARPYVEPLGVANRNVDTTRDFVVVLQEPKRLDDLFAVIDAIHERRPLSEAPRLERVEFSVDFWGRNDVGRDDLEALALRLMLELEPTRRLDPVEDDERQASATGTTHTRNERFLKAKSTLYIGPGEKKRAQRFLAKCPPMWRVYFKVTDKRKPIPVEEHRPRVEVRLDPGEGGPIPESLVELRDFRFESLARFFRMRRLKSEYLRAAGSVSSDNGVAGFVRDYRRMVAIGKGQREVQRPAPKARRKHPTETEADLELNKRIAGALRHLTGKFIGRNSRATPSR